MCPCDEEEGLSPREQLIKSAASPPRTRTPLPPSVYEAAIRGDAQQIKAHLLAVFVFGIGAGIADLFQAFLDDECPDVDIDERDANGHGSLLCVVDRSDAGTSRSVSVVRVWDAATRRSCCPRSTGGLRSWTTSCRRAHSCTQRIRSSGDRLRSCSNLRCALGVASSAERGRGTCALQHGLADAGCESWSNRSGRTALAQARQSACIGP